MIFPWESRMKVVGRPFKPIVAADDSVRVDQIREGQVVLVDVRASGTRPIGPVDTDQPGPPTQQASHTLQVRGFLLTRRTPACPEVDRGRLAAQGGERDLRRDQNTGGQLRALACRSRTDSRCR